MKNIYLLLLLSFSSIIFAQTPGGINYQAVLRDGNGTILKNENVSIDVVVRTKNGINFNELITTKTNDFGMINIIIGQNGGASTLKDLDWASGDGEIEISIISSSGRINVGTQSFQNMPYAFHAETAKNVENDAVDDADADPLNEIQKLSKNGNTISLNNNGGSVTDEVDDADADSSNEIQTITKNGNNIELSHNGGVVVDEVDDADANPSNEIQNLSFVPATKMLTISQSNSVDLSSLGGGGSGLWIQSPVGIFNENDAYLGHPDSNYNLHLGKSSIDFHVNIGEPTSVWLPESLWFDGQKGQSLYTGDSLEFKNTGLNKSILSNERLDFHGSGFQSYMTQNEVMVHAFGLDTYNFNVHDSLGFTSSIVGFINATTVQDPFSFKTTNLFTTSELNPDELILKEDQKYARLALTNLSIGENGLGNYASLYGGGFGALTLLNGANWGAVIATAKNDAGEIYLNDISGRSNMYLGFRSGKKGTGSLQLRNDNRVTTFSSTSDSGSGFSQLYGPNGKVNVVLTSRILNVNHGSMSVQDANGSSKAGMYVDPLGRGVIWGDMKNFVTEHPEKPNTDIWYASLEGPEVAAYDRGTARLIGGEIKIPLSDHFRAMVISSTMTVILTPHSADTYGLAVIEKNKDGFVVKELKGGKGNFTFDWEVKCKRKGYENWKIERPSSEKDASITKVESR